MEMTLFGAQATSILRASKGDDRYEKAALT